jgi:hypothetical protein
LDLGVRYQTIRQVSVDVDVEAQLRAIWDTQLESACEIRRGGQREDEVESQPNVRSELARLDSCM